ncbi:MAG TPA: nuclear transport factor 2 family protein [Candidatus Eisenbacteria bacterium]|jgi:ketosteroid isomerase-like protein
MSRAAKPAALAALALLLALGLTGCTRTPEKRAAGDPRTEIRTLFENYVEALNRPDSAGVMSAYAPDSQATLAGRETFFKGWEGIRRTTGMGPLSQGQNAYSIDTLEVFPVEGHHALALVVYTVEPSDQDIPAFHTTGTYVLEKTAVKWQIVHAHVCPAREM